MNRLPTSLALVALALSAGSARAQEIQPAELPSFSFGGFGSLGVVHSSEKQADFTASLFKPTGAGYTRNWSFAVDSVIAGQVTATFTRQLSAVLQVVAEQNADDTYQPHVEWANLKYQFTPELSVRVGRTVLPVFMVSDTRNIGYAIPWARPPIEVYNVVPVTSSDGIDAIHRMPLGGATNTIHVTVGRSDPKFPGGNGSAATAKARQILSIVDTFEKDFATVRLTCSQVRVTIPDLNKLFDAFRLFGPQGAAIADTYEVDNSLLRFCGIGASYDPGNWFAMAEAVSLRADPGIGNRSAWYLSGGYRFGRFTPYATYARARSGPLSDPGLTVANLPPALAGVATGLNAALNSSLSARTVQNTVSLGVRWDFARKAALKLQYDRTRVGAGSTGSLRNTQPGYELGSDFNVFSATVDFVF